jgi:hypothetical protein
MLLGFFLDLCQGDCIETEQQIRELECFACADRLLLASTWAFRARRANFPRLFLESRMALQASDAQLDALEASLLNRSGDIALHTRFRALFTLKSLKSEGAVKIICKGSQYRSFHINELVPA